jgi:hypothetical protein
MMKPSYLIALAIFAGSISLVAQQGSSAAPGGQVSNVVVRTVTSDGSSPQSEPASAETQNLISERASALTRRILAEAANCPAAMNVSHLPDGSMIWTGRAHPESTGQWLHITIMAPIAASATLEVHGYSNKGHMTQTDLKKGPGNSGPDAVRAVTVSFRDLPNGQATGNVWAPGLTAVTSIDLVSLTYVDGTNWSAPSGHTCQVTPDPLMLISGR